MTASLQDPGGTAPDRESSARLTLENSCDLSDASGGCACSAALIYAAAISFLSLVMICAPLESWLGRFMPDDTFYYYNVSRNLARTGRSTFDGIHFTNGYQPLWMLMAAPVFKLFPEGGEMPLRILMFVQLLLAAGATFLLVRTAARSFGPAAAVGAFMIWIFSTQQMMLNGLETALLMCLYGLLFALWIEYQRQSSQLTPRQLCTLGTIAGLTFLARTDSAFLIGALSIAILLQPALSRPARIRRFLCFAVPLGAIAGTYLATNLVQTGHLMPVSGAAKVFHSDVARQAVIRSGQSPRQVLLDNIFWVFSAPHLRYIAWGIVGPWLLLALSFVPRLRTPLLTIRLAWPFFVGATATWIFYGTAFYGGFTQTLWYYGPHAFLTCLTIAAIDRLLQKTPFFACLPGVVAVLLSAYVTAWFLPARLATFGAVALVIGLLLFTLKNRRISLDWRIPVVLAVLAWHIATNTSNAQQAWLRGGFVVLIALACLVRLSQHRAVAITALALALLPTVRVQFLNLRAGATAPPNTWGYNLYLGALWARDHLPRHATIWSGSSGALGYFSDRNVINTDGLANDFNFLEHTLKGNGLHEYLKQWDYTIDAMPDEALAGIFPEGRFLNLPPEILRFGFPDGDMTRRVRIFQMDARPPASRPAPQFRFTAPLGGSFQRGQPISITWETRNVRAESTISLCYDLDSAWDNGNEHWITVDGVDAIEGKQSYRWSTAGIAPGRYYLGGYLYDGAKTWVTARLDTPVELVAGERP